MWTVCYRGHAILPLNVATTRSVRLLFTISTKCQDKVRQDYIELWNGSSSKHENPVSVAQKLFCRQNWEWIEPFKLKIPTFDGEQIAVIDEMPWPETMHLVREGMRHRLLNEEQLHLRWDLKGLRDGIDFAQNSPESQQQETHLLEDRDVEDHNLWSLLYSIKNACCKLSDIGAGKVHTLHNECDRDAGAQILVLPEMEKLQRSQRNGNSQF